MENHRGQKRTEVVDELPADKRACNSLDFKPSSSNSSAQTEGKSTDSTVQSHEVDMETSSSASVSIQSEGEGEREYISHDSDDAERRYSSLHEYHRNRYHDEYSQLNTILSSLSEETGDDGKLAALTELCEVLSFSTEDSLSGTYSNAFIPILVKLANHESNPEIMLLALRAITYLCDVLPISSGYLLANGAIPVLCGQLMAIEYLDVAEQCLQALNTISREQPVACLQAGAIMAVLSYIDFFSPSVQRVALSTVLNICKKLPAKCPSLLIMDAVPLLCNLLLYEDRQLVESVAVCLINIVNQVCQSPEILDELCKHGLINQIISRISLNSHTMLSQTVYCDLFGVLIKLAAGSTSSFKTLHELNISDLLKDVLSSNEIISSNEIPLAMSSRHFASGHYVQAWNVLLLLKEMLPYSANTEDTEQCLEKDAFLANNPEYLCNFGVNVLPLLTQMVNSGADLAITYSCLSIVRNLFSLSTSKILIQVLDKCNTSSFLAGVFVQNDKHVLTLALQIAETCLKRLPDVFLNSFMKEGVFFAIDSLLQPKDSSNKLFQTFSGSRQLFLDFGSKSTGVGNLSCLCFTFDTSQPTSSSEAPPCNLEKDAVLNLAKRIRTSYFPQEICSIGGAVTDVLRILQSFSTALADLMTVSKNEDSMLTEKKIYPLLSQIVEKITSKEPISTFELIESGILNSLMKYLCLCEKDGVDRQFCSMELVEKRFESLVNLLLPLSDNHSEDAPLLVLVRKLQSAVSSLETFPIVSTHGSKKRNYFVNVPYERHIPYPSIRVFFVKEEGKACLPDYPQYFLVDPFASLDAVERFLFDKVMKEKGIQDDTFEDEDEDEDEDDDDDEDEGENQDVDYNDMQEGDASLSQAQPEQADGHSLETQPGESVTERQSNSAEHASVEVDGVSQVPVSEVDIKMTDCPVSSDKFDSISKLVLHLNGQKLDGTLTLYQAILEQQMKKEGGMVAGSIFWSQLYTLTYGKAVEHRKCNGLVDLAENPSPSKRSEGIPQLSGLSFASDLEENSSVFDILILLKSMNLLNKLAYQLVSQQSMSSFVEGRIEDLNYLKAAFPSLPENEFVSNKLTEKLEKQLLDPLVVSTGAMPLWCAKLLSSFPFLFSFNCRSKFFRLAAFGQSQALGSSSSTTVGSSERRRIVGGSSSNKFIVHRDRIMDSAAQMMEIPASKGSGPLEVEFQDEVGTGVGPTLEFFTSVSHEFQKLGLYMWRGDHQTFASTAGGRSEALDSDLVSCDLGLFPRPISPQVFAADDKQSANVISRFALLGKLVAKALQDKRLLDLHFSKSFYKLIIRQELCLFDILSFDPELGRTMLEFQALVNRRKSMESLQNCVLCFRNMSIEDLCLDFTLPGYPDYVLSSSPDHTVVNVTNLESYVSLVVDATIRTGIAKQVEAFKSGFNQVFPIQNLEIFSEEEVERLLCGDQESWTFSKLLDQIKFDHGYTVSSPPILHLLEIMLDFDQEQRQAFVQFVTGAPRLPPGGLASLKPKLTIVRKHCSMAADAELPSVMTCANYLKLPPYSSKEKMRERMLYAIKEGQGSFHLS